MTKLIVLIVLLAAGNALCAQGKIEVKVKNIRKAAGDIRVGLFNNDKDFLQKAFMGKVITATATEVVVVFENLPNGSYAVSVIHDENSNGEMDKNFIGIPKEGFAFGNNAMGAFGPPSFDKSKVEVNDNVVTQELALKYM